MPGVRYLPHQREAIKKLCSGSILCAGVGTGKSLTALGYFHDVECRAVEWSDGVCRGPLGDPKPLYIITTARKRDTHEWEDECDRFDFSEIPSITIDSWNNMHKYEDVENAFFIFDEQRVVGSGAWAKSFIRIARANHWILLSATPGDSWADYIPVFVANGFYKNRTQFLRRHAVYSRYCTKFPKIERWIDTTELERLRRKITVTMKYEKKTERHSTDIFVPYDRALYDLVVDKRWDPYKDEPIRDIAAACYLMRRVAGDGRIDGYINHWEFCVNAKALELMHLCFEKHPKLIVFYNFDYELASIRSTYEELRAHGFYSTLGCSIAEWNGHRHDPIPEGDRWMYLVQYNAGAEGWNCVETDTIVFFSQSYSYKMMEQASGRIDRMNTPFTDLYYYTLKTKAPIDVAVERALKAKRIFNERNFAAQIGVNLPEKA